MPKEKVIYRRTKPWFIKSWDKILFLLILAGFFLFYPGQNIYTLVHSEGTNTINELPFVVPTPAPYPTNITRVYTGSEITAEGIVIQDVDSGVILYQRNENEELSPASTTKILTALVVLDHYNLDDILTVKSASSDGSLIGLFPGEQLTAENLLYGLLIQSGNDAAITLAENYPGGMTKFVEAMNLKAKKLHLDRSSFANPVGYDDPNQKMTGTDLARLAMVALTNKTMAKMVAIPEITISDVTHTYFYPLKNVNKLLGKIPGVGGIKTGWTEEAGQNLVTLIERDGHKVIIVVLHSQDRFGDTTQLINWIFNNYRWDKFN